jgi:hypothetical protein
MKTTIIFIFLFLLWTAIVIAVDQRQIPNQLTLTVTYIRNDHDVILKDQKNNTYIMCVENAYNEAFVPGTIIYFGEGEIIIK